MGILAILLLKTFIYCMSHVFRGVDVTKPPIITASTCHLSVEGLALSACSHFHSCCVYG